MRRWAVRGLLLLLAVLACRGPGTAGPWLPLSPLQREYLVAHPTIVVGQYDSGWPPFESLRDGQQVGLGPDYLSHLARQLGMKVEARRYPDWTSVLDAACRGEIDVVMNVGLSADRTRCMVIPRPTAKRRWPWWAGRTTCVPPTCPTWRVCGW